MFFLQVGWVISGNNQPASVIQVKLSIDSRSIYNGMINSSSVLGMCLGSLYAAQVINGGRRKLLIIFGIVGIASTALTLVASIWPIIIGRLIFGFSTGVFMTAGPRMLDECVPTHLLGKFGVYTNIYANTGILLCLLLGAGLPAADASNELKKND